VIKRIRGEWSLRVSEDGELEGLDVFEHGTPAYHMEFGQGGTFSAPTGMPGSGSKKRSAPKKDAPV